jgi:hypothetical protein
VLSTQFTKWSGGCFFFFFFFFEVAQGVMYFLLVAMNLRIQLVWVSKMFSHTPALKSYTTKRRKAGQARCSQRATRKM